MSRIQKYLDHFKRIKALSSLHSNYRSYDDTVTELINSDKDDIVNVLSAFFIPPPVGIPQRPYETFFGDVFKSIYKRLFPYPIYVKLFDRFYFNTLFNDTYTIRDPNKLGIEDINYINSYKYDLEYDIDELERAYDKFIVSEYYIFIIGDYCQHAQLNIDKSNISVHNEIDAFISKVNNINSDKSARVALSKEFGKIQLLIIDSLKEDIKPYFYYDYIKNPSDIIFPTSGLSSSSEEIEEELSTVGTRPQIDVTQLNKASQSYLTLTNAIYIFILIISLIVLGIGITFIVYSFIVNITQLQIIIISILLIIFVLMFLLGVWLSILYNNRYIIVYIIIIFAILFIIVGSVFIFVQ